VTTSTLRFVLIVALVAGGILVINQAFPEGDAAGATGALPTGGGPGLTGAATGPTTPTGPQETGQQPANQPSPQIVGVRVAVFNTTGVAGLAEDVMVELEAEGYVRAQEPGNATADAVTRIFYRSPRDEIEAERIANKYFRGLNIEPARLEAGSGVDRSVQVAIFLGNDYATSLD